MGRKKTDKKRGRPTAELTEEERGDFARVWIEGGQLRERDVAMKLHRTVAPRIMDIGILLRKLADAVELSQPIDQLLAKIDALKQKVLDAVDDSGLDEWCALWGDDPPDVQQELEALDPGSWTPERGRAVGKKYIDAAADFGSDTGPIGRPPDLAVRHMALWIHTRKVSVRAVARELAGRFGLPERVGEFEDHLRNALRELHDTDGGAI